MKTATPFQAKKKKRSAESGQAMVEFVMMLIIVFALVVSMLHISNLLNLDYWAQQEARYLAFEQTWVRQESSENAGNDAVGELEDGERFRRPNSLPRLNAERRAEDDDGVSELLKLGDLAFNRSSETSSSEEQSVVLAKVSDGKDSIWHRSTGQWWASVKERTSLVQNAYASIAKRGRRFMGGDGIQIDTVDGDSIPISRGGPIREGSLEDGMINILDKVGFGEAFCKEMSGLFRKHSLSHIGKGFSESDCGGSYNRDFGLFIAKNIDIASMFKDYTYYLGEGSTHGEAIKSVLEREIATQFYSYFDRDVNNASQLAVPLILRKRIDLQVLGSDSELRSLITDARYVGSSVALTTILYTQIGQTFLVNPQGRDADLEKRIHDIVVFFINADVGEGALLLNPVSSFPVPPTFLGAFTGFQEGVMENVLRGGQTTLGSFLGSNEADESDLIDTLIKESNKKGMVRYEAGESMYTAARKVFSNETTLTSRFYLVTQPWHITRRVNGVDDFRLPGEETDGIGETTDEAMLRRRVAGLWLFPSAPGAMFTAPLEIFPIAGFNEIAAVTRVLDGPIGGVKSFLIDNPVQRLTDIVSDIPFIGAVVPTFPKWPAVRPLAYPGSTELLDQPNSDDDQLTGSRRNFSDYVEDQEYNPEAKPSFPNDTFN
jgi:hypothetical protein